VEWGSQNNYGADEELRSWLFTLKNPHRISARKFALKGERKQKAVWCGETEGPSFSDIVIADKCNVSGKCHTSWFGTVYENRTGLHGEVFFTGSRYFNVTEIEVFEILD
jgi:hypothetical protein